MQSHAVGALDGRIESKNVKGTWSHMAVAGWPSQPRVLTASSPYPLSLHHCTILRRVPRQKMCCGNLSWDKTKQNCGGVSEYLVPCRTSREIIQGALVLLCWNKKSYLVGKCHVHQVQLQQAMIPT